MRVPKKIFTQTTSKTVFIKLIEFFKQSLHLESYSNSTFLFWKTKSPIFYCLSGKKCKFERINLLVEFFFICVCVCVCVCECVFFFKQKIYILILIRHFSSGWFPETRVLGLILKSTGEVNKHWRTITNRTKSESSWAIAIKTVTAQKMKFSIKDFFSKCDQIRRKLRIWSYLVKKSLMKNFILSAACMCLFSFLELRSLDFSVKPCFYITFSNEKVRVFISSSFIIK